MRHSRRSLIIAGWAPAVIATIALLVLISRRNGSSHNGAAYICDGKLTPITKENAP